MLLEFELLAKAKKALNYGKISVGGHLLRLERWSLETGCLVERKKKSEAWVRILGLPVTLWDPTILRRIGEECKGFLAVNSHTKKLEDLQWARILMKTNREDLSNMVKIWVEEVCYSLTLWWEVRSSMRIFLSSKGGKKIESEKEVGDEVSAHASKHVMEEEGDTRLETLLQSVDRTWEQRAGRGVLRILFEAITGQRAGPLEACSLWVGPLSQA